MHLVQMPSVTYFTLHKFSNRVGIWVPKLVAPAPNAFMRDGHALHSHHFPHIPKAELEPEVEPHALAYDFRRKAKSEKRWRLYEMGGMESMA